MTRRRLSAIFPPPPILQRRAWEAAYVLAQDYRERLSQQQAQICLCIVAGGSEAMGWDRIGAALRMYVRKVETRI